MSRANVVGWAGLYLSTCAPRASFLPFPDRTKPAQLSVVLMGDKKIVGILPDQYVHVLDLNTNVTVLEVGPQNLVLQGNHKLVAGPLPLVKIPPGRYVVVINPIDKSKCKVEGKLYELSFGYREIRLHGEPFPLFPGEELEGASPKNFAAAVKSLPHVSADHGLHLRALVTIERDDEGVRRVEGEEWQLRGPLTYIPRPGVVEVVRKMTPRIIHPGHALRLRATQDLQTQSGDRKATGEEWLVRDVGAYLPGVFEEIVSMEKAVTLTPTVALHIRAIDSHTDQFGRKRHIGDEWLVTEVDTECYIPDVTEELVNVVQLTILKPRQYCVVVGALGKDGRPQLGHRELRCGPLTFFLQPGEQLEYGIKNVLLLQADEAVVVTAQEEFDDVLPDGTKVHRSPGDRWMLNGPMEYIPPIQIGDMHTRKAIPLGENEGVYVRDVQTGQVRSVMGPQAYLLKANEELFQKMLVPLVEDILKQGGGIGDSSIRKMAYFESFVDSSYKKRDKTRVITYRCPSNCAVQVYNYAEKTARVVFGPDLVILNPHETFNVLFLSAGKPKKAGALMTICLMLGPDFISDEFVVETSDHARLRVALAMNNHFTVKRGDPESEAKLFSVPDFIGFACRDVASKIRGTVAGISFENFHKYSNEIIRAGVFGRDKHGKVRDSLVFPANNLVITNVDVRSIEPVDQHMRDSLSKSVQMAIEISTKSIERAAQHEAKRTEQKAKGELERQKLQNEKEAEEARHTLLELQAVTAAVESSGQSKAEAQARAERLLIEGQSAIELAELKAEAVCIESEAELECQTNSRRAEIQFLREENKLEISKAKELGNIEVSTFSKTVECIGQDTISTIATAGPQAKMQLLQSLGIQNVVITDGKTPLNMYHGPSQTLTLSTPTAQ